MKIEIGGRVRERGEEVVRHTEREKERDNCEAL